MKSFSISPSHDRVGNIPVHFLLTGVLLEEEQMRTFTSSLIPSTHIFYAPTMCQEWWCLIGTQKKAQEM